MSPVRTTVTLDPDVANLIQQSMQERGLSFKQAVNAAIRAGLAPPSRRTKVRTPTFQMGQPAVPLDGALRLAGQLEDEETLRKLASGT